MFSLRSSNLIDIIWVESCELSAAATHRENNGRGSFFSKNVSVVLKRREKKRALQQLRKMMMDRWRCQRAGRVVQPDADP